MQNKLLILLLSMAAAPALLATTYFGNTGTPGCSSIDGAVGTFTCGTGAAQVSTDAAINGFGFYISSTYRQYTSGVNGAAPLGAIVDGSHDPSTADTASGCNVQTITQHCETLTFTDTGTTVTPLTANSEIEFAWNNIGLTLADFSGPNGAYIDQYYVQYIIMNAANTVILNWTSPVTNFTKTGTGTGSGPTSETGLSGTGFTTLTTGLTGAYTVEAILHVGWVWLGPQTGTPAAAGSQGPGIDLDMTIGTGSLDIGDLGAVPEPATIGIAGLGLGLIGLEIRRRASAR